MSTYDDASLVLVPSGYKNGVVFSQKPMDANGQLTFTRASDATRVGPNGYIEKVRTNYLINSNTFTSWNLEGGTITGGFSDPDGGLTAYKYVQTTGGLYSNIAATDSLPKITSIYLKSVNGTSYNVTLGNGGSGNLTLVTVTPTWQRFTNADTAASTRLALYIYAIGNVGGVMVWHPQAEYGDVATDYIPTTSAAVSVGPVSGTPRLDYLGSDCPRLLLEPAATALNTKSEDINGWLSAGGTSSANTTETLDPSGYYGADIMNESCVRYFNAPSSSATYTFSCFAKAKTGTDFLLRIDTPTTISATFNLSTGAISGVSAGITPQIQNYGNGWWRCAITFTQPIVNYVLQTANNAKCYVWGANLVQAAYATSYIPTLGTSVTRVADDCVKTSATSIIGQTEGVIFINWDYKNSGSSLGNIPICLDGGLGNEVYFYVQSNGNFDCEMFVSSVRQFIFSGSLGSFGTKKIAIAYKQNDFALYINGVQIGTDTSGSVPAMNRLYVGRFYGNTAYNIASGISEVLLFKTRLTNAQLAELTTL
jgi:hypothetical protein